MYKYLLLTAALLSPLTSVVLAQDVPLADANDSLSVTAPAANAIVSGNVVSSWQAYDDDLSQVPYELTLRRGTKCEQVVDVISSGTMVSSKTQLRSITWASGGPLPHVASVPDGKYCIEVCTALSSNAGTYSACSSRGIQIRNNNKAPQFNTTPPADRTIFPTENWSYDAQATDPEGDSFSFKLDKGPSFLVLNNVSGLLQTKSGTKAIGEYQVVLAVEDVLGRRSTQEFTLRVAALDSSSSSTASAATRSVEILTPAADAILIGKQNRVSWQVSGGKVDAIRLNLLNAQGQLLQAVTQLEGDLLEYSWDVSSFTDSEYRLQVQALVGDNVVASTTSSVFKIANKSGDGLVTTRPLILNVVPAEASKTSNLRQPIAGEFVQSIDASVDLDTFQLFVDGQDRKSWCSQLTNQGFTCTPDRDFKLGEHKIRVSIADALSRLAAKEWTFEVVLDVNPTAGGGSGMGILGQNITAASILWFCVVCVLGLTLLLVPWWIYNIWRRRQETESGEYVEYAVSVDQPATTVNNYVSPFDTIDKPSYLSPPPVVVAPVEVQVVKAPTPKPKVVEVAPVVVVDPTKFDSYDDYLKAVEEGQKKPASAPREAAPVVVVKPEEVKKPQSTTQSDPNYIAPPDYMRDFYTSSKPVKSEEKADDKEAAKPSWLDPLA